MWALARELLGDKVKEAVLELNASDERFVWKTMRKIDFFREKIKKSRFFRQKFRISPNFRFQRNRRRQKSHQNVRSDESDTSRGSTQNYYSR